MIMSNEEYKKLIKQHRYTIKYCAETIGLSPSALGMFLNGKRQIKKSKEYRLQTLLGVDETYGSLKMRF